MKLIALSILTLALGAGVFAAPAGALPSCTATGTPCRPAGSWFWNKAAVQYHLMLDGLDIGGKHYDVRNVSCYGSGKHQWGSKGIQFQQFHCSLIPFDLDGNTYSSYGITFYVRGHYAWTWGR